MIKVESLPSVLRQQQCLSWLSGVLRNSLVRLFRKGVELSDGIIESLLSEVTSSVGAVQDLVAGEDNEKYNEPYVAPAIRCAPFVDSLEDGEV